jgi:uncharacterized protein
MKMKLPIFAFIATVLLLSVPLYAQNQITERIIDNADILTVTEKTSLERLMEGVASKYNFNLVILTEKHIGTDAINHSWNFLDSKGFGGETWDGCLLLQSTGERDYALTASGRGDKILNSSAYDKLEKDVVSLLRQDDYAGAYEVFIRDWEKFLVLESKGRSYNFLCESGTHAILLIVAWLTAFFIGFLAVRAMKAKMNTALSAKEADTYIVPHSLILTQSRDNFLYSTVTKSKRQSAPPSSGRSISSGGRSSRSGKY